MKKTGVGLYGSNGHQIHALLADHPSAELIGTAAFPEMDIPAACRPVRQYGTLPELLADERVELVSLCSPRRADQARDAILALNAGKHVYAEKPAALAEDELDEIIAAAKRNGRTFHEMAGTVVQQPYMEMRREIQSGAIGEVVQILAQKSYPWHERRPTDEAVDGGLAMQVGIFIARFVEHIAGSRIASLQMEETKVGNSTPGSACRMAVSMAMRLENGGLATGICNYLNPMADRLWGYDILRVFGTKGLIESNTDGAARILVKGEPPRVLVPSSPSLEYFDLVIDSVRVGTPMPLTLEEELSPTRWVIRAKTADTGRSS